MPRKKPEPRQPGPDWFLAEWMHVLGKMKQSELGRLTGWGKARASEICNGKTEFYREILNTAAEALNLQPYELLLHPDEAMHIRRLRAAAEDEYRLRRVAEEQRTFRQAESGPPPPLLRKTSSD